MTDQDAPGSMIRWREGTVRAIGSAWRGAVELEVSIQPREPGERATDARALAYPALVGTPQPGDRLLLNTTALAMGLGTGGYALVIANLDRLPADPVGPGHLVKMRYSPLQATVLGVDEQDTAHHETIRDTESIGGMPVVIADLHSALPAVLAGIHDVDPDLQVAYVWTDGGALPAWFSRTLAGLRDRLVGTITTGQAVGGDLEAVTVHTALLAARSVLGADVAIVAQGPGNLGTGTPWGFSGVAAGEAANAVTALAGRPIGALRISEADPRGRHVGVSHHSTTAFFKIALGSLDLPVPAQLPAALRDAVDRDLRAAPERVAVHDVDVDGLDAALRALPVRLSTMGRGLDEDYWYFMSAAAAGRYAATLTRA